MREDALAAKISIFLSSRPGFSLSILPSIGLTRLCCILTSRSRLDFLVVDAMATGVRAERGSGSAASHMILYRGSSDIRWLTSELVLCTEAIVPS